MSVDTTAPPIYVSDGVARTITIVRVLLDRAADELEETDRLLQGDGDLDRKQLREKVNVAWHLALIAAEELDAIERPRP